MKLLLKRILLIILVFALGAVAAFGQQQTGLTRGQADLLYAAKSPAVTNLNALSRWYQAAPRARVPGIGGVDVVAIGDSINEGANAWTDNATYLTEPWTLYLARRLQGHFNPSTVEGGHGFLPVRRGDNVSFYTVTGTEGSGTSPTNAGAQSSYNDSGNGTAARQTQIGSDGTARYYIRMDGSTTSSLYNRTKVTSFEVLARRGSSYPIARIDVSTGSAPTIGSGGVLATTVATAGAGVYGRHTGILGLGTVSATGNNYFSFAGAATGNPFFFDGAVFYNQDEAAGVRVHNLSNYGTSIASQDTATGSWEATTQFFQTPQTDTTTTGASRGALFIINWGTNDIGGSASTSTTLPVFLTALGAQYDAALALPSRPSVLHIIEPPRGGVSAANAEANFRIWIPAIKALAIQKGVCVLDLWSAMGNASRSGLPTTLGFNDGGDNLHFTKAYQAWRTEYVYRLLTAQDFYTEVPRIDEWIALAAVRNNYAFEG